MKFSTTPDVTALVFSPLELRPGKTVAVTYSYVDEYYDVGWDSGSVFTVTLSGTPTVKSVKGELWPIPESYISVSGNTVTIQPTSNGIQTLSIFYKVTTTELITSVSAITATDSTYYNDWYYDDTGMAVPLTVIPLNNLPSNEKGYQLKDFTVAIESTERGVATENDEVWRLNSNGTIKMTSSAEDFFFTRNLMRKGKTMVRVPMHCSIEPVHHYEFTNRAKSGKFVYVDLQEWYNDESMDFHGCLWHRDYLYVLTDTGLHRFERWGSLAIPDDTWSTITGNDLTYAPDDRFLITDGTGIKVYRVRHDFAHLNRDTETVSTRESDADIEIIE